MVRARELRFCFVIEDYEAAVHLYRDVFGLEVLMDLDGQDGRGVILKLPQATLELVDAEHGRMVDEVEVGRPADEGVRIAVRVDDLQTAARAVADAGGDAMAPPVETPWGDRNQRFRARDGLQVTLFQSP
jgi:catechol 2,3-dioxygenase-like lactoylglutathione lyase family enzyme